MRANRFFIIGCARSGTTLLRLMLNKHSLITVPPEAGFMVWLYEKHYKHSSELNYSEFIERLRKTKKIENWKLNFNELNEYLDHEKPSSYSELIDCVYEFYSKSISDASSKVIYGDKNNFYLNHMSVIDELYPESKFIHIVRDGRSLAVSYKELMSKKINSLNAPVLPDTLEAVANKWKNEINIINDSMTKIDKNRCIEIKFEDLVINPQKTLKIISSFLNIPYEDSVLEYYKTTEAEGLEPKEYGMWKYKNNQNIDSEEAYKYKQLPENEILIFNALAFDALAKYGYL